MRMEASRTEAASDKFMFITPPFQDSSLENLTSHVHPFCVIVKAATALLASLQFVPPQLRDTALKVTTIGSRWSLAFPTNNFRAVSSKSNPSPHGSRRSHRLNPYPRPHWLGGGPSWQPGLGGGVWFRHGPDTGIGRSDVDAMSKKQELHLAQNEEPIYYPPLLLVGLSAPFLSVERTDSSSLSLVKQASHSFDQMDTFDTSECESSDAEELDEMDAVGLIRKVQPWRNGVRQEQDTRPYLPQIPV